MIWNAKNQFRLETEALLKLRMLHDQMSCHQVQTRQIRRWGRGNGHGQEHSHSRLGHKMRKNDETY